MDTQSRFHICLGPDQEAALEVALLSNHTALLDVFAHIDVRAAKASEEDTALIMGAIERLPNGASGLNGLAMGQMTSWAKDKARSMVATRRGPDGMLVRAECELREVNELALLLENMGETAEARRLYEEVIEGQTAQLGGSHTGTLQTRVNFAVFLANSGDLTASKLVLDELHDVSTEHHGTEHPMTQQIAGLVDQLGSMLA